MAGTLQIPGNSGAFAAKVIVGSVVGMRFNAADGNDKDIEFERIEPVAEDKANDSVVEDGPEALL
jgi:hypothetical protein